MWQKRSEIEHLRILCRPCLPLLAQAVTHSHSQAICNGSTRQQQREGFGLPRAHHAFGLVCSGSRLAGGQPGVVLRVGGGGRGWRGLQVRQAGERAAADVGGGRVGGCRAASSRRVRQLGGLLWGPIRQLWRLWDLCRQPVGIRAVNPSTRGQPPPLHSALCTWSGHVHA